MNFPAANEGSFIGTYLGPVLRRAGLGAQILGYDHNWDVPAYPEQLYADPAAAAYVPGTAWHCYGGDVSAQSTSHNDYPHAQAFETECSGGTWQGTDADAFAATMGLLRRYSHQRDAHRLAPVGLDGDHREHRAGRFHRQHDRRGPEHPVELRSRADAR
jgi:O-glycosyl hydrolase